MISLPGFSGRRHQGHAPVHTVLLQQSIKKEKIKHTIRPHDAFAGTWIELGHTLVTESQLERLKRHQAWAKQGNTYAVEPNAIIPLENLRDSQYVGPIGVGSINGNPEAEINVVFDTGSTNLWISSSLCQMDVCNGRNKFNPKRSESFTEKSGPRLDITFGTGELRGPEGTDVFSVGPYKVQNQTFALIEDEIGSIFRQLEFEGILGLGFPSLAAEGHLPFFDNVMAQNVLNGRNEFSFYFTKLPIQASAVFFGGVDDRFYTGEIKMFPVVQEHYWSLYLEDFLIGNTSYAVIPKEAYRNAGKRVDRLIADTGTTYFTAPPGLADLILRKLPGTNCNTISDYPDITYKLVDQNGAPFDLKVEPSVYMVSSGGSWCEPAFMEIPVPDAYGPAFLLGEVFMRAWHTTFDRGDGSSGSAFVGFARARHDAEAISALLKGRVKAGTVAGLLV
jgi:pepsin A